MEDEEVNQNIRCTCRHTFHRHASIDVSRSLLAAVLAEHERDLCAFTCPVSIPCCLCVFVCIMYMHHHHTVFHSTTTFNCCCCFFPLFLSFSLCHCNSSSCITCSLCLSLSLSLFLSLTHSLSLSLSVSFVISHEFLLTHLVEPVELFVHFVFHRACCSKDARFYHLLHARIGHSSPCRHDAMSFVCVCVCVCVCV